MTSSLSQLVDVPPKKFIQTNLMLNLVIQLGGTRYSYIRFTGMFDKIVLIFRIITKIPLPEREYQANDFIIKSYAISGQK